MAKRTNNHTSESELSCSEIGKMPDEVLCMIILPMDAFDRCRLSRVSHQFETLLSQVNAVVWRFKKPCRPCGTYGYRHLCGFHLSSPCEGDEIRALVLRDEAFKYPFYREDKRQALLLYSAFFNEFAIFVDKPVSPNWSSGHTYAYNLFWLKGEGVVEYSHRDNDLVPLRWFKPTGIRHIEIIPL